MEIISNPNSRTRRRRGEWTAELAEILRSELPDFDIFYDHGDSSGRIVCYIGDNNERGAQLSYLDIAIVRKNTNQVVGLIEIEETANRPKTIIADIFAFLLGEKVTFQGRDLQVGNETTLLVVGYSKVQQSKHQGYILDKVEKAKTALGTNNAKIGKIVIETYSDKAQLQKFMTSFFSQS